MSLLIGNLSCGLRSTTRYYIDRPSRQTSIIRNRQSSDPGLMHDRIHPSAGPAGRSGHECISIGTAVSSQARAGALSSSNRIDTGNCHRRGNPRSTYQRHTGIYPTGPEIPSHPPSPVAMTELLHLLVHPSNPPACMSHMHVGSHFFSSAVSGFRGHQAG